MWFLLSIKFRKNMKELGEKIERTGYVSAKDKFAILT